MCVDDEWIVPCSSGMADLGDPNWATKGGTRLPRKTDHIHCCFSDRTCWTWCFDIQGTRAIPSTIVFIIAYNKNNKSIIFSDNIDNKNIK